MARHGTTERSVIMVDGRRVMAAGSSAMTMREVPRRDPLKQAASCKVLGSLPR
jgi:hypothetical protein